MNTLNYVLHNPRTKINMNIFGAEIYEAAVVVQPLIGTLVYYSNDGQYRPRLADSFVQSSDKTWEFALKPGLKTEVGEPITAETFMDSLKRSIRVFSKKGPIPVLHKLRGYEEFVAQRTNHIEGIRHDGNKLIFEFESSVRSGLLQILSFAPFGFISERNFNSSGDWADNEEIISSGPYRLKSMVAGERYILEPNPNWELPFAENAPRQIVFIHDLEHGDPNGVTVFDSARNKVNPIDGFSKYPLVPEYLNPILLGNLQSGLFSSRKVRRQLFSAVLDNLRTMLPESWDQHVRSTKFYDLDLADELNPDEGANTEINQADPIVIEGSLPRKGSPEYYAWQVLEPALEKLGIDYRFAENPVTMEHIQSSEYDIRLRGSSVGGGIEVWGVNVLFCSDVGVKFPDPTGSICSLVSQYESFEIDEETFKREFYRAVGEDLAILPISYFGNVLYFSEGLNTSSIKPTLNVIKFDQLEM